MLPVPVKVTSGRLSRQVSMTMGPETLQMAAAVINYLLALCPFNLS
jgi:hypothetical protein